MSNVDDAKQLRRIERLPSNSHRRGCIVSVVAAGHTYQSLTDSPMTSLFHPSGELTKWAARAGYSVTLSEDLIVRFGSVIRDELGLDVLRAPWSADRLAVGYTLTDLDDGGCRALVADGATVAMAGEDTLSLLALVPLSHYMRLGIADLIASFLDVNGAPLLVDGTYGSATGG